ncbi:hypothetical protein KJ780_00695 [Candidatus Micrarchaeota archaeon]|nr:hypothetical protein [Candidatus Micrarchaeota archaeon]
MVKRKKKPVFELEAEETFVEPRGGIKETIVSLFGIAIAFIIGLAVIFLYAISGALFGALIGFLVEITPILGDLVKTGLFEFGIENANLIAIGAALGFLAGFFKQIFNRENQIYYEAW